MEKNLILPDLMRFDDPAFDISRLGVTRTARALMSVLSLPLPLRLQCDSASYDYRPPTSRCLDQLDRSRRLRRGCSICTDFRLCAGINPWLRHVQNTFVMLPIALTKTLRKRDWYMGVYEGHSGRWHCDSAFWNHGTWDVANVQ